MERSSSTVSDRIRLNVTQLKQKVIYLQSELAKYKRKLKKYKEAEKFDNFLHLKKERDELQNALHEQQDINNEIHHKNIELMLENEKYKEQFATLQNEVYELKNGQDTSYSNETLAKLSKKITDIAESTSLCMDYYEESEKRLKNHDKELAKLELLFGKLDEYAKNELKIEVNTLKAKVEAIEEAIMKDDNTK